LGHDKGRIEITKVGENKEGWTKVEGYVSGKKVSVDMATADVNKGGREVMKRSLLGTVLAERE
jgi:hypothetical protein